LGVVRVRVKLTTKERIMQALNKDDEGEDAKGIGKRKRERGREGERGRESQRGRRVKEQWVC
jgi:hypothetical protein